MEEEMVTLYKGTRKMEVPLSEKEKWLGKGWEENPPWLTAEEKEE